MAKPAPYREKLKVSGIAKSSAKDKFLDFMKNNHTITVVSNTGSYVSLHLKITMEDKSLADVTIFTNDTITVSASPYAKQTAFENLVKSVQKVANASTKSLVTTRPLAIVRAQELIDYTISLNTSDEKQRMVAIILSDTANEIVLTEKLKSLNITGPPLIEGVPDKIKRIKNKGEHVYRESELINVRELRNDIVHRGVIPMKAEADTVIQISSDFVRKA